MIPPIIFLASGCVMPLAPLNLPLWEPFGATGATLPELVAKSGYTYVDADVTELTLIVGSPIHGYSIKRISLNNRVEPRLDAETTLSRSGTISYNYRLSNGASAFNSIVTFLLVVPQEFTSHPSLLTVDGRPGAHEWQALDSTVPIQQCEIPIKGRTTYVSFTASSGSRGVLPGNRRSNFEVDSLLFPGFTTMYATGPSFTISESLEGDFDETIGTKYSWSWKHIPVLGPMFARPYNCAAVLENYQGGTARFLTRTPPNGPQDKNSLLHLNSQLQSGITCQAMQSWLASNHFTSNQPVTSEIANALRLALDNSEESKSKQH